MYWGYCFTYEFVFNLGMKMIYFISVNNNKNIPKTFQNSHYKNYNP